MFDIFLIEEQDEKIFDGVGNRTPPASLLSLVRRSSTAHSTQESLGMSLFITPSTNFNLPSASICIRVVCFSHLL